MIIISQRVIVVRAIDELTLVWEASRGEEWVNHRRAAPLMLRYQMGPLPELVRT